MNIERPLVHHNVMLYFEGDERISKIGRNDLSRLGHDALRKGFTGYGRGRIVEGRVETPFLTLAKDLHDGEENTNEIYLDGSHEILHWLATVSINSWEPSQKLTNANLSAATLISTVNKPGTFPDLHPFTREARELQAHIAEIQSDQLHMLTSPQ